MLRHELLCPRRQSNQNAAGETPDPHFLFNRSVSEAYPVATELLQGRWPLVIGAEGVRLRLTALGLMVVSCFADERAVRFPQVQAAQYRK